MFRLIVIALLVVATQGQRFDANRPPLPLPQSPPGSPIRTPAQVPVPSIAAPIATIPQERRDATCTERNARYPKPGQCDAYIECRNWKAKEMLCPDGLRFRPEANMKEFPCAYPIDVICKERASLQPAQPTQECPHMFGYFRTGDSKNCGTYRSCVAGRGFEFHCPEGLAYNSATYRCEWPDLVIDCDAEAFIGFSCPVRSFDENGQPLYVGNLFYKHERDCRKYYACVEGKPRLLSCEIGKAFDELTSQCEDIETVQGCLA